MLVGLTVLAAVARPVLVVWVVSRQRAFSTGAEEAAFAVLHQANQAAPPLRAGLSRAGVRAS